MLLSFAIFAASQRDPEFTGFITLLILPDLLLLDF
jgi:hypothetical protein